MHPESTEETLFAAALVLRKQDRAAYLAAACEGNPALLQRVESLLQAHESATSLLRGSPGQAGSTVLTQPSLDEPAGAIIGHYKLLQKIGEGGCGTVYLADQERPVRRRVALKIIKPGMDTKEVIARFEAERQALALMDHPNIAKVFDGGSTANGRPFFVMELVRGIPITQYCDDHNLPMAQRLQLFIGVCEAVQHAHQKGIIHRDLKPSNILITENDGSPAPKVIDFGIAKATQARLTEATLFTAFQQFLGTPAYMSPEQASTTTLDIDTRSDIYSLGVLLYELLAGRPPFDPKQLATAGLDEMRRLVQEVDPLRPSARLATLTGMDRTTVAKARGSAPAELLSILTGDLDWIVMKALEKDRNRRYESASAFAADILRHMENEPVLARPPSKAYLLQKLIRRHRLLFAATMAISTSLVVALGVSSWAFLRQKRALEFAVAGAANSTKTTEVLLQAAQEQAELQRKNALIAASRGDFSVALCKQLLGLATSATDAGQLRAAVLTALAARSAELEQPHLPIPSRIELCDLLGDAFFALDTPDRAEPMYRQVVSLRRELLGPTHPDTRAALAKLNRVLHQLGKPGEIDVLPLGSVGSGRPNLSRAQQHWILSEQSRRDLLAGRTDQAIESLQQLIASQEANPTDPATFTYRSSLAHLFDIAYLKLAARDVQGASKIVADLAFCARPEAPVWSQATPLGPIYLVSGTLLMGDELFSNRDLARRHRFRLLTLTGLIALRQRDLASAEQALLDSAGVFAATDYGNSLLLPDGLYDLALATELTLAGQGQTVSLFLARILAEKAEDLRTFSIFDQLAGKLSSERSARAFGELVTGWQRMVESGSVPADWQWAHVAPNPRTAPPATEPTQPLSPRDRASSTQRIKLAGGSSLIPLSGSFLGWMSASVVLYRTRAASPSRPRRRFLAGFCALRGLDVLFFASTRFIDFKPSPETAMLPPIPFLAPYLTVSLASWVLLWAYLRPTGAELTQRPVSTATYLLGTAAAMVICGMLAGFGIIELLGRGPFFDGIVHATLLGQFVLLTVSYLGMPLTVGLLAINRLRKWPGNLEVSTGSHAVLLACSALLVFHAWTFPIIPLVHDLLNKSAGLWLLWLNLPVPWLLALGLGSILPLRKLPERDPARPSAQLI